MSLLQTDTVVQFTMLWIALESLDPLLRQHFRTGSEHLEGIKALIYQEIEDGSSLWRHVKDLRIVVFHSTVPILPKEPEISLATKPLSQAVRHAVSILLNIDFFGASRHPRIGFGVPTRVGFEGHLKPKDFRPEIDGQLPFLMGEFEITKVLPAKDGSFHIRTEGKMETVGPPGVTMDITATRFRGEGVSSHEIRFQPVK